MWITFCIYLLDKAKSVEIYKRIVCVFIHIHMLVKLYTIFVYLVEKSPRCDKMRICGMLKNVEPKTNKVYIMKKILYTIT